MIQLITYSFREVTMKKRILLALIFMVVIACFLILGNNQPAFAMDDTEEKSETVSSDEDIDAEDSSLESEEAELKDKAKKTDEAESSEEEMSAMSMASGGTSEKAAGGVYSNPQAVTVSQVGAAQFSYPIEVPPGRNGLQPNISLQYSSYNENGWIGVGWDLDLGAIERSRKTGLNYSANDFMANDSDLVPNSNWGSNYYCEKIEGAFTKYQFVSGSNYWIAYAKDGTKLYYGQTAGSRMANGSNTYSWHLDKVEDTNGNYMTISYTTVSNQIYPYQISYTGNSGGLSPNKIVEFGLETRADNIYSYKTKYLVTSTKRLKTITVKADGTTVYKYILNYDNSGPNGRSRLTQIKRVDPSNENNYLPTTDFSWINGGNGTFGTPGSITLNGPVGGGKIVLIYGDINGDGRQDFIKAYAPNVTSPVVTVYPYLANSSGGFTAQTSKTLEQCLYINMSVSLGDVNGDGKADILSNGLSGQAHVYLSNGDGTFSSKYTTTGTSSDGSAFLAELNGDGKADLVRSNGTYARTALSNGNGYFGTQKTFEIPMFLPPNSLIRDIHTKLAEVNGDGKADLYVYKYFEVVVPPYYSYPLTVMGIFLGNGDGTFSSTFFFGCTGDYVVYSDSIADINGDGLSDLAYLNPNKNLYVYLSNGTGMTQASPNLIGNTVYSAFADINDDGMADMINPDSLGNNYFYKSNGDGTFASPISAGGPTSALLFADIDGDGRSDMIKHEYSINTLSYSLANGEDAGDRIESVTNPLGGQTDITYGNSSEFPNNKIPYILHPVTLIDTYDGIETPAETSYTYSGAYYKYNERDFRGFGYVKQTNPDLTTIETTYELNDNYKKGRPLSIEMKEAGETDPFMETTFTWENYTIPSTDAKFVKLTDKRVDIDDGIAPVYTEKDYTYDDSNGNLLTTISSGTDAEDVTKTNSYVNKGDWVWRLSQETITGSASGQVRKTDYTYQNTTGNLLTTTYWLDGGASPFVTMGYDSYGNVTSVTDARGNPPTTTTYDITTYTYPETITYPVTGSVSHVVGMEWDDRYGKITLFVDQNGQETEYSYDTFGRLQQVDYADGGQTIYEYNDFDSPVSILKQVKETSSSYVDSYTYYDGYGRPIQTISSGEGSNFIVTRDYYDKMGRNYRTEGPYFSTGIGYPMTPPSQYPYTEIAFDYMGRPETAASPNSSGGVSQVGYEYAGFVTTVTDPDGYEKTYVKDYLGRIIEVQEDISGGTTLYTYNAAGDLLDVEDDAGNITHINYDTLGRKKNMSDPDMGYWQYTYDANGNLLTQIDAKGQTITFTYDELNRVKFKDYSTSDPDVTYTYDGGLNGIGLLYRVQNSNVTTTVNSYDVMGRVTQVTKTITGDSARVTGYAYDLSGKILTVSYPGSYIVTNTYHAGSNLLYQVYRGSTVFATLSNYTPTGKIGTMVQGNGVETIYSYNDYTTRLSSIYTHKGSTILQNRSYTYSDAGDITRIDDTDGVTYDYTYDDLHRLETETNDSGGVYGEMNVYYDAIGNITQKTVGSNTLTYSYNDNNHKHAVSAVNGYNFVYDNNGNMTDGYDFTDPSAPKSRHITYNADNMPVTINYNSGQSVATILYDGTGARAKKTVGSSITYYIGDHYEIIGGTITRYIFAGNLRVAQVKGSTITYFHKDHLGSSTVITNSSGNQIESTNYMPFGGMRAHSGTNTSNYKFTDQEMDAENGLYNYNARMYDPIIGRFISPDTEVSDPYDPQSLNRYAYVRNNPLIYTDPTGHYWYKDKDGNWREEEGPPTPENAKQDASLTQLWGTIPHSSSDKGYISKDTYDNYIVEKINGETASLEPLKDSQGNFIPESVSDLAEARERVAGIAAKEPWRVGDPKKPDLENPNEKEIFSKCQDALENKIDPGKDDHFVIYPSSDGKKPNKGDLDDWVYTETDKINIIKGPFNCTWQEVEKYFFFYHGVK
jgi:RHS repeat-associated protein